MRVRKASLRGRLCSYMGRIVKSKNAWYADGLRFECVRCGRCCSGPGEGYIWVTRPEIKFIADHLAVPLSDVRRKFLKRIGLRRSIIENPNSKDCIFLEKNGDAKRCRIYPVRPGQCRTWPFWSGNLAGSDAWDQATRRCNGVNQGRHYSFEQIEKIRKTKKWWENDNCTD